MRYFKITRPFHGSYVQPAKELLSALSGELEPGSDENSVIVSAVEMTEEEYKKLPEFNGW